MSQKKWGCYEPTLFPALADLPFLVGAMKILVCAGHGGNDPGNTWGGTTEAALMLELRHIVALKLRQAGHEVTEDGGRGVNLTLNDAIRLAHGHDVAIELHTNASANQTATGVEVIAAPKNKLLAQRIAQAVGRVLEIPVRRDGGLYPLAQFKRERQFTPGFVRAGGLIVEVFFQSNPAELGRYRERFWLVATAIADAVTATP